MKSSGIQVLLAAMALSLLAQGCNETPRFEIGDCLIPMSGSSPEKIVRVVSANSTEYKVFTSFLSDGRLTQAKDYQSLDALKAGSSYSKVECPRFDGDFSPDAYLNRKR